MMRLEFRTEFTVHHVRTQGEGGHLQVRNGASPDTEPCHTLIVNLLGSRTVIKLIFVF